MTNTIIVDKYPLDEHQMKLINCNKNAIVIAGAGSGKTLTILGKVKYLVEHEKIQPENILLISFTNASVNDITSRIKYNVNVLTFHKLAMHILDKNNFTYTIAKPNLLKFIINEYLKTAPVQEQKTILKFLKTADTYPKFLQSKDFQHFANLIDTFINFYKTNNHNLNTMKNINFTKKEQKILIIIFKIYSQYMREKKSTNTLDFDDLIIYATEYATKTNLNFKYIIIDEFQDTSQLRLNLIKAIYNNENPKIIVVGDDWQSIYHFSGCDLNIFLNFAEIFPDVATIKLVNTYRNSQELINIAANFIQKNPNQITKKLISPKHEKNPFILIPYTNKKIILKETLNKILANYTNPQTQDILILGRNNYDILAYLDSEMEYNDSYISYKNLKIRYLTIHKSKGLEADYTIIINCDNNINGFPNKIENNKIIQKLNPLEKMPYAEERRLFYVAITRCKHQTYLIYDKKNPSIFIKELKKILKKER